MHAMIRAMVLYLGEHFDWSYLLSTCVFNDIFALILQIAPFAVQSLRI